METDMGIEIEVNLIIKIIKKSPPAIVCHGNDLEHTKVTLMSIEEISTCKLSVMETNMSR
jgi:hypothetical protein